MAVYCFQSTQALRDMYSEAKFGATSGTVQASADCSAAAAPYSHRVWAMSVDRYSVYRSTDVAPDGIGRKARRQCKVDDLAALAQSHCPESAHVSSIHLAFLMSRTM